MTGPEPSPAPKTQEQEHASKEAQQRIPLRKINEMSLPDAVMAYDAMGLKILACSPRGKNPIRQRWSNPKTHDKPEFWQSCKDYNIGCPLGRNGLISVDIDSMNDFRILCEKIGSELKQRTGVEQPFWKACTAGISSGRKGSGKLIFREPPEMAQQFANLAESTGKEITKRAVSWKRADGSITNVVEFRRSDKMQDILPPSIHPLGDKYQWVGEADDIIDAPADLSHMMVCWEEYNEQIARANPDYEKIVDRKKEKSKKSRKSTTEKSTDRRQCGNSFVPCGLTPKQFAEWNRRYTAVDICVRNGYKQVSADRLLFPGSATGDPGVQIQDGGTAVYSHHAGDPLNDGNKHDAYDCVLILETSGNKTKAVRIIWKDLGLQTSRMVDAETGELKTVTPLSNPCADIVHECHKTTTVVDCANAGQQNHVVYTSPEPIKPRTLEEIADEIAEKNPRWMRLDEDTEKIVIELMEWWSVWQDETCVALDADSQHGVYWFDDYKWQHIRYEKVFLTALDRAMHIHQYVGLSFGWNDVKQIASLRPSMMSFSAASMTTDYIYCKDGTRIRIDTDGIHIDRGDPKNTVWISSIEVSGAEIFNDLTTIEFAALLDRFPNFRDMMVACDSEQDTRSGKTHAKMIATIASSVVYSYFSTSMRMPALDVVFWLYDVDVSRTGKSTHAGLLQRAFGRLATKVNLKDLMGNTAYTGNLLGVAMAWADEASECKIEDTGLFKSLPSGTATVRPLYRDPVNQTNPVVIVATANGAPKIPAYKITEALKRRLMPYQYTIQHEPASNTGCPENEAFAAIINFGLWGCYHLIKQVEGGGSAREVLPFQSMEDDIEKMLDWVDWSRTMGNMLTIMPGNDIEIATMRRSLVWRLVKEGRCEEIPKSVIQSPAPGHLAKYNLPPALQNDNAFRNAIKTRILHVTKLENYGYEDAYKTCDYQCATPDLGSSRSGFSRFVLRGVAFRDTNDKVEPGDPQAAIGEFPT